MKDATEILMGGFAMWFALLVGNVLLNRAPEPVEPEAIVMEAEDQPIEPAYAPTPADIAYVEAMEPAKLPPQKPERSVLPAARVADTLSPKPAPALPLDPIQPTQPALEEPTITPASVSAPTSAPVYQWHNTIEEAVNAAKLRNVPVLIHFVAPPCRNCKLVRGMIDKEPSVQRELSKYSLVEVDGEAHSDIADEFKIREWNTWVLYLPWRTGDNAKAFIPLSERVHFLSDLKFTQAQLEK